MIVDEFFLFNDLLIHVLAVEYLQDGIVARRADEDAGMTELKTVWAQVAPFGKLKTQYLKVNAALRLRFEEALESSYLEQRPFIYEEEAEHRRRHNPNGRYAKLALELYSEDIDRLKRAINVIDETAELLRQLHAQ